MVIQLHNDRQTFLRAMRGEMKNRFARANENADKIYGVHEVDARQAYPQTIGGYWQKLPVKE